MKEGMGILEIEDKGKGISPQLLGKTSQDWMGVGVRGMNERMQQLRGRLELASTETGTTVRAMIPVTELAGN